MRKNVKDVSRVSMSIPLANVSLELAIRDAVSSKMENVLNVQMDFTSTHKNSVLRSLHPVQISTSTRKSVNCVTLDSI